MLVNVQKSEITRKPIKAGALSCKKTKLGDHILSPAINTQARSKHALRVRVMHELIRLTGRLLVGRNLIIEKFKPTILKRPIRRIAEIIVELIPTSADVYVLAITIQNIKPDSVITRVFKTRNSVLVNSPVVKSSLISVQNDILQPNKRPSDWVLSFCGCFNVDSKTIGFINLIVYYHSFQF
jgi:hypothetical protein